MRKIIIIVDLINNFESHHKFFPPNISGEVKYENNIWKKGTIKRHKKGTIKRYLFY